MNFSQRNKLAHEMGAFYENGYWRFPSVAVKESFERRVAGVEWTPAQREHCDAALVQARANMQSRNHPEEA